ncbi:MAG: zinc-dependent alcohol dehydrogenase [Armatimonadota bacterium]
MRAAVLHRPEVLRIEARPVPQAHPGWVVLAVEAAGICGTDVAVYQGQHPANLPIILGHEFAGRVLAVGEGVNHLGVGQRVLAQGGWACGQCANCRAGRSEVCLARVLLGRTVDGCFADAVAVRSTSVYALPDTVSMVAAQSIVTVATAVHATARAGEIAGRRIAIIGSGHAGLLLLQVCLTRGIREAVVFGTRKSRLEVARSLGAQETVDIRSPEADHRRVSSEADAFDVTFEASGTPQGLAQAIRMTRVGGTVVAYGIITTDLAGVPGYELYARELTLVGSRGAGQRYQEAIELLALGTVRVEPLITHRLPLDDADRGFSLLIDRLEDAIRIVLTPEPDGSATRRRAE